MDNIESVKTKAKAQSLPQSTIKKFMKDKLPKGTTISNEFVHYIQVFSEEFISTISLEAARISEAENKHLLTPDYVIQALQAHGFRSIASKVETDLAECSATDKSKGRKRKTSDLDPEALERERESLRRANEHFESLKRELEEL